MKSKINQAYGSTSRKILRFTVIALAGFRGLLTTSTAQPLSLTGEVTVNYDFASIRLPVWSGGGLAAFSSNATSSPILISFNEQGQQVQTIAFTIPGGEMIDLDDISRGPDGTLAVCGKAFDKLGRGSGFFAIVSPGVSQATVARLYPYYPSRITIASDGTIWTVGVEAVNGKENDPGVNTNDGVLRHFDRTGKLLASLIPRSSLSSPLVAMYGFLRSANGRIGWYTGPVAGPGSTYYEVTSDGTLRKYPALVLNKTEFVTGFGLTDNGRAYVTTSDNKNAVWRLLCIAGPDQQWSQEAVPQQLERATLYGAEGARLVFLASSRFKITFADISR